MNRVSGGLSALGLIYWGGRAIPSFCRIVMFWKI
jgi:hypothetical protein